MSNNNGKRAAIYTRASRPDSRHLPIQLEDCRRFCKEHGYDVVESLVVAEGASPTLRTCKGLERILNAALHHEFDVLVHRDPIDLRMIKHAEQQRVHKALEISGVQQVNLYDLASRQP